VEAGQPVPWTKPDDLPYDAGQPLPKLGGINPTGFNALFVDGSVRFIPKNTSEQLIRAFITYAGGEPIPADAP
jgi:prepilin-type processing-associated H-X9-DG protein